MSRWFRVYDDLVDDPKVQRLPADTFRGLINLWCLASKGDGVLPTPDEIAFKLRLSEAKTCKLLDDLVAAGLIEHNGETWTHPHNWSGRQHKSDVSNERVKRHRERQKQRACNVTDTVTVTPPEYRDRTDTERGEANASLRKPENPDWPKDGFRRFYARYPRKQKPQDAEKAWAKIERIPGLTFELVMAGVERLIASEPDAQFIPYPASWLNAGQWADVIPPKTANGGSHVREGHSVVAAARQMLAHSRQLDERERPELLQIGRH